MKSMKRYLVESSGFIFFVLHIHEKVCIHHVARKVNNNFALTYDELP